MNLPISFDDVFVISDLHLGGREGFQVFDQGELLAAFINFLRELPKKRRVALVINGDMVDFLAERPGGSGRYFAPEGAVGEMERIAADPSFLPVWKALAAFCRRPGRRLVVTLGNHDLELALPWVRTRLVDLLTGGHASARGRFLLSLGPEGFLCRVGGRRVLAVHGNEVDSWNVTDHRRLGQIARDHHRGREIEPWIPNAGTQLVIDVINHIKTRQVFIDLLKPEDEVAARVAYAVDPDQGDKIRGILRAAARRWRDGARMGFDLLGHDGEESQPSNRTETLVPSEGNQLSRAWLSRVEGRFTEGATPFDLVGEADRDRALGWFDPLFEAFGFTDEEEALRRRLQNVRSDNTFALDRPGEIDRALDRLVSPRIDFLVTGHTHLERVLSRPRGLYLNTGTWIPLLRLRTEHLRDRTSFAATLRQLVTNDKELWQRRGLLERKPAVAHIRLAPEGRVRAGLYRVVEDGGIALRALGQEWEDPQ